jgi:hypothetical protein
MSGKTARRLRREMQKDARQAAMIDAAIEDAIIRRRIDYVKAEAEKELTAELQRMAAEIADKISNVWVMAIRDEYGFGRKRMNRLVERVNTVLDDINAGLLSFEDVSRQMDIELHVVDDKGVKP